jgi:hypothetical protein
MSFEERVWQVYQTYVLRFLKINIEEINDFKDKYRGD